jgi:outer membrane protein
MVVKTNKNILLNFIAPLALFVGSTSFVAAESLGEALRQVQATNAKLEAERARSRGDNEKIPQARAGFLPTVSLNASTGQLRDKNLVTGTQSKYDPRNASISFSQPIFNGFRNVAEYQRAHDEVLASMASLVSTQQQTLLYGAQAYLRVLRDRRILALRQQNLGNLRTQQDQANARFKAGDMTLTGVDQTRARVAEAEADVAQTRADLADSEAYYRYMIGHLPGKLSAPALSRVQLPCSLQDAVLTAENDNPGLQTAAHLDRASEQNVKSAKAAHLPSFSFDGSYTRSMDASKVVGSRTDDASLALKMSMPLFNGGLDASRVRQAEEARAQKAFELTDSLNNTRRGVASAFDTMRATKMRKVAAQKRVQATSAALHGLNIEFKAGQIPLVNVLDGRREHDNAQVTQAMVDFEDNMNVFTLLSAIGHLDMPAVDAITAGRGVNASRYCGKSAPVASRNSEPLMVHASKKNSSDVAKIIPNKPTAETVTTVVAAEPVIPQKEGALSFFARKTKELSAPADATPHLAETPVEPAVRQSTKVVMPKAEKPLKTDIARSAPTPVKINAGKPVLEAAKESTPDVTLQPEPTNVKIHPNKRAVVTEKKPEIIKFNSEKEATKPVEKVALSTRTDD